MLSEVYFCELLFLKCIVLCEGCFDLIDFVSGDRVDGGVEVKSGNFGIVLPYVNCRRVVVWHQGNFSWPVVVEMGKGYFVLCSDGVSHDDLVDIVEFIPILIEIAEISVERLELGASGNGHVEGFGGEERFEVEQVVVIFIDNVGEHLIGESVQIGHGVEGKSPFAVGWAVDFFGVLECLVVVEPVVDCIILIGV